MKEITFVKLLDHNKKLVNGKPNAFPIQVKSLKIIKDQPIFRTSNLG